MHLDHEPYIQAAGCEALSLAVEGGGWLARLWGLCSFRTSAVLMVLLGGPHRSLLLYVYIGLYPREGPERVDFLAATYRYRILRR